MGLLDRFKTQPRWKHADPTVRAMGVQDLQDEEHDLLVSLARTDPDPRVRRAAVSRLGNVAVLTEVVRRESDAQVRDEAAGVLLDIALGAYEADEAASLAAVEGLTALPPADAQKQLVLVAKTARRDAVSRRALDRLRDEPRALGTTARRAESAETRLAALARLADPQELTATALKSDYKDVALGALERITDPQALARDRRAREEPGGAASRARAAARARGAGSRRGGSRSEAAGRRRGAPQGTARSVPRRRGARGPVRLASGGHEAGGRGRAVGPRSARTPTPSWRAASARRSRRSREGLARHEAERAAGEQLAAERAREVAAREALRARVSLLCRPARSRPRCRASGQTGRHCLRSRAETTLRSSRGSRRPAGLPRPALARRRWWKNSCSGSRRSVPRPKRSPAIRSW